MLDHAKLEHVRSRGAKLIARCPACAELGADKTGNHLLIGEDGRYTCINYRGSEGIEHRKRIHALAGVTTINSKPFPVAYTPLPARVGAKPSLPRLRLLDTEEMAQVAHLRGWTYFGGLQMLANRGLLWHGNVWDGGRDWPAWIITDSTRRNTQARKLDGGMWDGIMGAKAKTLPGSDSSWPIGTAEIQDRPIVMLCEGQPDFCAALLVAWFEDFDVNLVAPVCITGSGNSIHTDALPYFAGKHIRIAIHDDIAGYEAAERWSRQLYFGGANVVDGFDFTGIKMLNGRPVKDLADFATQLDPECTFTARILRDMVIWKEAAP